MIDSWIPVTISGTVLIAVNALGWLLQGHRNNLSDNKALGRLEQKVDSICEQLTGLPCKQDPDYLKDQGSLLTQVGGHEDRLHRLEQHLNNKE